jgi:hypothetical protein
MVNNSFHPAITGLAADPKKKLVTAYILFSADIRKLTMEENPGGIHEKILRSCLRNFSSHVPKDLNDLMWISLYT